jgi:hypothetical protein
VFGCKCFVLNKKPKTSNFAPKVDEGFLLGYGSNEHAYRVFNKTFGRVEIAVDVTFDESNDCQVEQVDSSVVEKEDPPCDAIKQLAIGDIRPQENEVTDVVVPEATDEQVFADVPESEGEQTLAAGQQGGSAAPRSGSATPPLVAAASLTLIRGQNLQPIFEEEEVEDLKDEQAIEHSRLKQTIQRDHPADNILGSLRKEVLTRSYLAIFFINITLSFLLWNQSRLRRHLRMKIR